MTEYMEQYFDEANVTGIDPAPHLRLLDIKSRHNSLQEKHVQLQQARQQLITAEIKAKQMKPRAELSMLETKKYLRFGGDLKHQALSQSHKSSTFNQVVQTLKRDVTGLVTELRNYEISGRPQINVKRALKECR